MGAEFTDTQRKGSIKTPELRTRTSEETNIHPKSTINVRKNEEKHHTKQDSTSNEFIETKVTEDNFMLFLM